MGSLVPPPQGFDSVPAVARLRCLKGVATAISCRPDARLLDVFKPTVSDTRNFAF